MQPRPSRAASSKDVMADRRAEVEEEEDDESAVFADGPRTDAAALREQLAAAQRQIAELQAKLARVSTDDTPDELSSAGSMPPPPPQAPSSSSQLNLCTPSKGGCKHISLSHEDLWKSQERNLMRMGCIAETWWGGERRVRGGRRREEEREEGRYLNVSGGGVSLVMVRGE